MADKGRFGPGLTEAEIDALVDNTTPRNTKEVLLILLGLAGYKMIYYNQIAIGGTCLNSHLSLHIHRALVE